MDMKREKLSKAAASGVVALVFLVLGFQAAVFTGNVFNSRREHHTADTVVKIVHVDAAGTVLEQPDGPVAQPASRPAERLEPVKAEVRDPSFVKQGLKPEKPLEYADSRRAVGDRIDAARIKNTELFRFDPNRISVDSLCLLGFSHRQAEVIQNYRSKGGKFNVPKDFAKMYVVDSTTYARLEPYIYITKVDLNTADSAMLVSLRGIGPYYAAKILEYRKRLGGAFTSSSQLMEVEGIDAERFAGLRNQVEVRRREPYYTLWTAGREELETNPYIGPYAAKGIIRYRSVADSAALTLQGLVENGIITEENAARLRYLAAEEPGTE